MSTTHSIGSKWKGLSSIRRLVIFGDSYSAVEQLYSQDATKPSAADPFGVPFPGSMEMVLWNEMGQPNWVGHLITKNIPGPRYIPPKEPHTPGSWDDQSMEWIENPLLVNNYARPGDTVDGVARQIRNLYLPGLGTNPAMLPWTTEGTLFVTWVGINDCAYHAKENSMDTIFALQSEVYNTGARDFLFIDLPPIHRSPAVPKRQEQATIRRYLQWNNDLREAAKKFSSTHADSSVFIYSSFDLFSSMLDEPAVYGVEPTDVKKHGGSFWSDHIHPTSLVHQHLAAHLAEFLLGIPVNTVPNLPKSR